MNPLTALPAKVRKAIYAFYAALGIAFGATQVGYATANVDQPLWLLVAFGVFAYLGTALGLVAASNVTSGLSREQYADFERQFAAREAAAAEVGRLVRGGAEAGREIGAKLAAIDEQIKGLNRRAKNTPKTPPAE